MFKMWFFSFIITDQQHNSLHIFKREKMMMKELSSTNSILKYFIFFSFSIIHHHWMKHETSCLIQFFCSRLEIFTNSFSFLSFIQFAPISLNTHSKFTITIRYNLVLFHLLCCVFFFWKFIIWWEKKKKRVFQFGFVFFRDESLSWIIITT